MAGQTVLLPSGAPLFIVDKSWLRPQKTTGVGESNFRLPHKNPVDGISVRAMKETKGLKRRRPQQEEVSRRGLQFVNITQLDPVKKGNEELQRLVRSHVMTGTRRPRKEEQVGQKRRTKPAKELAAAEEVEFLDDASAWSNGTSSSELSLVLSDSSTPFYGTTSFPVKPHFHRYMSYYVNKSSRTLYPLESYFAFNPVKADWFPLALTDEILLHTIMFSAAIQLSQLDRPRFSNEPDVLVAPIFRLLKACLQGKTALSDATIGAVSCLAMVETTLGNPMQYRVHMNGLKSMAASRGGLAMVNHCLQMKIMRADMEGAVDNLSAPYLHILERTHPTLYSTTPKPQRCPPSNELFKIISSAFLSQSTQASLLALHQFAAALEYSTTTTVSRSAIHPRSFDEDVLALQRSLLSAASSNASSTSNSIGIDQTLRVGALIFLKCITRDLPFPATASTLLVRRLRSALASAFEVIRDISEPLLLWLLFMGGIASRGAEREWFVEQLFAAVHQSRNELRTWEDVREDLKRILWVGVVFERPCVELW